MSHRPLRPTPIATSRRVLALEFIRRYFVDHGQSPSYGEIAAGLGIPTQRVGAIVRELEERGEILRGRGARAIRLPDRTQELSDSEVMLLLQRRGWTIGKVGAAPPLASLGQVYTVPNPGLPPPPELDDLS